MARKTWDQLSDAYRKRLQRAGIGPKEHATGQGIARARGHRSKTAENSRRRFLRERQRWAERYAETYGQDFDVVEEALSEMDDSEIAELIADQTEMERLYQSGHTDSASQRYAMRTNVAPDNLNYYHGIFR
jgi:hypothetical protein